MFDLTKEEMMKREAARKAHDEFSKILINTIIESESVPDHMKYYVRALHKARDIRNIVGDDIPKKYCTPEKTANTETLKKVLEYLELVEVGLKQFLETTPFVAHTEEEYE